MMGASQLGQQKILAQANIKGVKVVFWRSNLKFTLRTPTCRYVGTDYHGLAVTQCSSNQEIPRVSGLSGSDFLSQYFLTATPVILTDMTETWPARDWTIEGLRDRVGDNKVWVRGQTNKKDYRTGKAFTIRKARFGDYCTDLLAGNAKARSSYLAVRSIQQSFPQLLDDVPLPVYLQHYGKLHRGPNLWLALKGHYEFNHFDPDDNFLVMIKGRKRVRLFKHDIDSLYPNPLGSHGKTIQSQVNLDSPDLEKFPKFANAHCQHTILHPGEMLFIPAFFWHQVSALDTGISMNFFYGDPGENRFLNKLFSPPYVTHFNYWFLNIIEQNRECQSFSKMLPRLPEVVKHFVLKQWHEIPSEEQIDRLVDLVKVHCDIKELPTSRDEVISKFPPVLKIRGLLHRGDKKKSH